MTTFTGKLMSWRLLVVVGVIIALLWLAVATNVGSATSASSNSTSQLVLPPSQPVASQQSPLAGSAQINTSPSGFFPNCASVEHCPD